MTGSRGSTGPSGWSRCLPTTCWPRPGGSTSSPSTPSGSCCRRELAARIVRESRPSRLPGLRQVGHDPGRWRYLLPYMPRYFRSLDLSAYDLVVVSSHACAINASPPPGTPCVCYCHTPMRYAWLTDTERGRARRPARRGAAACSRAGCAGRTARPRSARTGWSPTRPRCADRIRRFYDRDADVVHPPVEVERAARRSRRRSASSFLWVGRLVPYKRPAAGRRGLPRPAPAADDGRDRPPGGGAARAAAGERRAARLDLARGAGAALPRGGRASSTSAKRTSGSRWSRRSPPGRR